MNAKYFEGQYWEVIVLLHEELFEEVPEKPELSEDDSVETELDDDGQIGLVLE